MFNATFLNMLMKAVVYNRYGAPDILEIEDIEKPIPNDYEVLLKVCASSINVEDLDYLKGNSWAVRMLGLFKPKYNILGFDVTGIVELVGKNITKFKPGDEVMGELFNFGFGAFAEYVCAPEEALVLKPTTMTFEEAAAVPSRGLLALQGLRSKRPLKQGQKVLINGAGGGVGPFAVQITKFFGAQVTAVDNGKKLDMLRSIGADFVIDYTKKDFTKTGEHYDLILDIAAHHSLFSCMGSLSPKGIYTLVGGSRSAIFQTLFLGTIFSLFGKKKMGLVAWKPNKKEDLEFVLELIKTRKIAPVIDRCYPLDKIVEAFRYFEEGQPEGKVVITMESDDKAKS